MPQQCAPTSYYIITYKHPYSFIKEIKNNGKKNHSITIIDFIVTPFDIFTNALSENLTMDIDSTKNNTRFFYYPYWILKPKRKDILTFKNTANLNILIKHQRVI